MQSFIDALQSGLGNALELQATPRKQSAEARKWANGCCQWYINDVALNRQFCAANLH